MLPSWLIFSVGEAYWVNKEIDNILSSCLIFSVGEAYWVSSIVIKNKKDSKQIWICVDYRNFKFSFVHDPFSTPFSDEFLDNVVGNEAYSFTNEFIGYQQVMVIEEDNNKTKFTTEWGSYVYHVMPFGLRNALGVFSRIVISTFIDYIHRFVEV